MYRVWTFLESYVWTLGVGAALALVMANLTPGLYATFTAFPLGFGDIVGQDAGRWLDLHGARFGIPDLDNVTRVLTVTDAVTKLGMALFIALAAKELWEALILDRGALRGRDAVVPIGLALGGMAGAAAIYLALDLGLGLEAASGWAIPATTDIAVAYVLGRIAFGETHPALRLLLVMAVADDGLAIVVLALFHSQLPLQPLWLIGAVLAGLTAYLLANRLPRRIDGGDPLQPAQTAVRLRLGLFPYALAGSVSMVFVARAGLHPALGLLPVLPALPHARRAFGVFASAEKHLHDLLNRAEQMLRYPVGVVLFLLAFCQAGVPATAFGPLSAVVIAAMLIGKPVGVLIAGWILGHQSRVRIAPGTLARVSLVASAGLTMSLLLADAARLSPEQGEAARLGVILGVATLALAVHALRPRLRA